MLKFPGLCEVGQCPHTLWLQIALSNELQGRALGGDILLAPYSGSYPWHRAGREPPVNVAAVPGRSWIRAAKGWVDLESVVQLPSGKNPRQFPDPPAPLTSPAGTGRRLCSGTRTRTQIIRSLLRKNLRRWQRPMKYCLTVRLRVRQGPACPHFQSCASHSFLKPSLHHLSPPCFSLR